MINVVYRKMGLRINAVWFIDDIDKIINTSNADIIFFHKIKIDRNRSAIMKKQDSLITDLTNPLPEIFQDFSKNYRYQINKANRENIECCVYDSKDIKNSMRILDEFKGQYEEFVQLKGIKNTYNQSAMGRYIENGNVILTKAYKDGIDYAQHIYVSDQKRSCLLYSVSNFRTNKLDTNLIGRANKYLHWFDIQYFSNKGFEVFDWGGISSLSNPNGIDNFKIKFGGKECSYYNLIIGRTVLGKLAVFLMKLKSP